MGPTSPPSGHRPTAPPNDLGLQVEIIRLLGGLDRLGGVDVDRAVSVSSDVDDDIRTTPAELDIRAHLMHSSDAVQQVVDLAAQHDAIADAPRCSDLEGGQSQEQSSDSGFDLFDPGLIGLQTADKILESILGIGLAVFNGLQHVNASF